MEDKVSQTNVLDITLDRVFRCKRVRWTGSQLYINKQWHIIQFIQNQIQSMIRVHYSTFNSPLPFSIDGRGTICLICFQQRSIDWLAKMNDVFWGITWTWFETTVTLLLCVCNYEQSGFHRLKEVGWLFFFNYKRTAAGMGFWFGFGS